MMDTLAYIYEGGIKDAFVYRSTPETFPFICVLDLKWTTLFGDCFPLASFPYFIPQTNAHTAEYLHVLI